MRTTHPAPRSRTTPWRPLAMGLVTTVFVASGVALASPALASTTSVMTKADLSAAVAAAPAAPSAPTSIALGAELTSADASNDLITTPDDSDVVLDLQGHELDLQRIVVGTNATLEITDSVDSDDDTYFSKLKASQMSPSATGPSGIAIGSGATLRVVHAGVTGGATSGAAGIGSPTGVTSGAGTLALADHATVRGFGGDGGAGIGGARGAAAVLVTVRDSTLFGYGGSGGAGIGSGEDGTSAGSITTSTTPQVDGDDEYSFASVYGWGGDGGAGIGGGLRGAGGSIDLGGTTFAAAYTGSPVSGAGSAADLVGFGQGVAPSAQAFGSLHIGANASLYVPGDDDLMVPAGVTVQNEGSIGARGTVSGQGTVANTGSIGLDVPSYADPQVDPAARISVAQVTGNNYLVAIDTNGGTSTGRTSAHVFDRRLDTFSLATPTDSRPGYGLISWNTRADGSGEDVDSTQLSDIAGTTSTTGSPVPLTIYAQYGVLPHFTGTSMPDAGLNQPYDQPVPIAGDGIQGYDVDEYDSNGDPIPGLPAGLTIDESTGHVSGTPTETGTFTFRVEAYGRTSIDQDVTMHIAGAPTIATSALPDGQAGTAYSTQLSAAGEGTITFDLASGALPAGMTLSSSGVLSGTPTASGPSSFTIRATSIYGATTQPLTLAVAPAPVAESAPAVPAPPAATASAPAASTTPAAPVAPTTTAAGSPSSTATTSTAPAPAVSHPVVTPAPAAPKLAAQPRTTVKFGHQLHLAVAADSTLPVTYRLSGDLPSGISLNRTTGLLSGVPAEVGTFTATVTATSTAGSASTDVVITVPKLEELIHAKPVPATEVGAAVVPLKVAGLKKGEHWRVQVDGKTVATGKMRKAGTLHATVHLKEAKHDTVHHVTVSTSRAVKDPAQRAATEVTVTSLIAKKHLPAMEHTDRHGRVTVSIHHLAAHESVIVKDGSKMLKRGTADSVGAFSFTKKLHKGTHHLTIHGATAGRAATLTAKVRH